MKKLNLLLAAETLDMINEYVEPDITTERLNVLCHEFMLDNGATPATLGYRGFPKSCCISINHVVCHGIPGVNLYSFTSKMEFRTLSERLKKDFSLIFNNFEIV